MAEFCHFFLLTGAATGQSRTYLIACRGKLMSMTGGLWFKFASCSKFFSFLFSSFQSHSPPIPNTWVWKGTTQLRTLRKCAPMTGGHESTFFSFLPSNHTPLPCPNMVGEGSRVKRNTWQTCSAQTCLMAARLASLHVDIPLSSFTKSSAVTCSRAADL